MRRFLHQLRLAMLSGIVATGFAGARVASAEANAYCDADFNHDGRVTLQEYESWAGEPPDGRKRRQRRFKELTPRNWISTPRVSRLQHLDGARAA